jgi:hypothetical protein
MEGAAMTFPLRTIPQLLEEFQIEFPTLGIKEEDFRRPSVCDPLPVVIL